jgi:Raf kinase inhibitor-like YbhB/YbcL family protein
LAAAACAAGAVKFLTVAPCFKIDEMITKRFYQDVNNRHKGKTMNKLMLSTAAGAILFTASACAAEKFILSSPDIKAGQSISEKYYWNNFGCSGANEMPALEWKNAPSGTKSYAITLYDRDAPTGSGFWHWVAYNIPANIMHIDGGINGGKLPAEVREGNTDLGKPGFFGPCPPVGRKHHYIYTVYALKSDKLDIPPDATAAMAGFFLWQNTIAKSSLTVTAGPRK